MAGGQALTIQWRKPSGGSWNRVASVTTQTDGSYEYSLDQQSAREYRVVWGGVCESVSRTVRSP